MTVWLWRDVFVVIQILGVIRHTSDKFLASEDEIDLFIGSRKAATRSMALVGQLNMSQKYLFETQFVDGGSPPYAFASSDSS